MTSLLVRFEGEDGGGEGSGALWAAAELGEYAPGLESGDGAFAGGSDGGVCVVGLGPGGRQVAAFAGGPMAGVALAGEGGDGSAGEGSDEAVGAGGGQVVGCAGPGG